MENHEKHEHLGRESNPVPPEYRAGMCYPLKCNIWCK